MTENITTGDIVNYGHDVHKLHETKRGANTLATVIGIVGALILIGILWNVFVRRNDTNKSTEKNTDIAIGGNVEAIEDLKFQVRALTNHERQDALKIAYTDGRLQPYRFSYLGDYEHEGCGCGEHHRHRHHKGCCDQKYQEVATYNLASTTLNKTSNCNC